MSANEDGTDPIGDAIKADVPGMVTAYFVVADYIGDDGEGRIFIDSLTGQTNMESLGLLAWATARVTHCVGRAWAEGEL